MRIRDPVWKKVGSGIGKNIPDPQHWIYDLPAESAAIYGYTVDLSILKLQIPQLILWHLTSV